MNDNYEDRRTQRREEERKYQGDVWYEVWRSGGDPDRLSPDRIQDDFYRGLDYIQAASNEMKRQQPKPVEMEYPEEESGEEF